MLRIVIMLTGIRQSRFGRLTAHAVRSLALHRLRAVLSIIGVICGVMVVVALLLIGAGARQEALEQIEQLGIKNIYVKSVQLTRTQEADALKQLSTGLGRSDMERMLAAGPIFRQVAGIREISADTLPLSGDVAPQILACTANLRDVLNLFVAEGRFISDLDVHERNQVCILGETVARKLGANGAVGSHLRINSSLYRIVGILKEVSWKELKGSTITPRNHNTVVFIPLGSDGGFAGGSGDGRHTTAGLTEMIIQVRDKGQIPAATDLAKRVMTVTHGDSGGYQVVAPRELLQQAQKTRRNFNLLLAFIAGITLFAGGVGIMNIMLATVTERTREIGIRRALGASRSDILIQFLTEAVVLSGTGGIIGVVAGLLFVTVAAQMAGWRILVTLPAIAVPLAMSLAVGVAFGLYPAKQAAAMDPVEALRHE